MASGALAADIHSVHRMCICVSCACCATVVR